MDKKDLLQNGWTKEQLLNSLKPYTDCPEVLDECIRLIKLQIDSISPEDDCWENGTGCGECELCDHRWECSYWEDDCK